MSLIQVLVTINLVLQILLLLTVSVAAYLAKFKKQFLRHCTIIRIAVIVQLVTIAVVMLPSMLGYIGNKPEGLLFSLEIPVHHALGLLVVALWIYVNLAFKGIIKIRWRLAIPMRLAFSAWTVTLAMGLHIYFLLWIG